jgi:hypothetical protein
VRLINSDPDRQPDWEGLTQLVRAALEEFKFTPRLDADIIRSQIENAEIVEIDFTGHGFYARFNVSDATPVLTEPMVHPALLGVARGGGEFIGLNLWLNAVKRIDCLEGFNLGDAPFTGAQSYVVDVSQAS